MAYKFQAGEAVLSGTLKQEGSVSVYDSLGLQVLGDEAGTILQGYFKSGSNGAELYLNDGSEVSQVKLEGNGTISGSGAAKFGSTLAVMGTIIGQSTVSGTAFTGHSFVASNEVEGLTLSSSSDLSAGGNLAVMGTIIGQSSVSGTTFTGNSFAASLTLSASTNVSAGGNISADGTLQVFGNIKLNGAGTATPSLLFDDSYLLYVTGTNQTAKVQKLGSFVSSLAGVGITYNSTTGKLDGDASSTPTEVEDANATLVEGLNFATGSCQTVSRVWTLPSSPSAGDLVRVKAYDNVSTDSRGLTIRRAGTQTIDGTLTEIVLESNNASLGFVAATAGSAAKWQII